MSEITQLLDNPVVKHVLEWVGAAIVGALAWELKAFRDRRAARHAIEMQELQLRNTQLAAKLRIAATESVAAADLQGEKLKAQGRNVTPVAKNAMARAAFDAKLAADPDVDEKAIGDDTITFHIEASHAALKETVRTSQLPPSDGSPPIDVPARPKSGFSGTEFPAIQATTRDGGDTWEVDLPRDPATLDEGGEK
jgi:hypothetical protein